jgi:DHA1 family bicyclomycin/chloramphenicol resistance-like MFS transporter
MRRQRFKPRTTAPVCHNRPDRPAIRVSPAFPDRPAPTPPAPVDTRPRGAPLLLLLGILTAIASLSIDMYLPALPAIAADLRAAPGLLEATLAAFFAGFALGQLVYGPLSDRIGRRPPLIGGLVLYTLASVVCATAATPEMLIAGRAAQALGGAAALVIARAVVRDLYDAQDAARVFSRLILIMGLAPVLAPSLGSLLLVRFSWRAVFWLLAAFGAACLIATLRRLPETSPRPATGGLATVASGYLRIFRDLRFVGLALGGGFAAAGMFAYIAASPFVFIEQLGLSPRAFAIVFGCNAFALIGNSQLNRFRLRLSTPAQILGRQLYVTAGAAIAIAALTWAGVTSWLLLAGGLFVYVGTIGAVGPNTTAAALARYSEDAGSASALLGSLQFGLAALAGIAVSTWHDGTARPLGTVVLVCGLAAWVCGTLATTEQRPFRRT